jgi:phosphate transport system permease protein
VTDARRPPEAIDDAQIVRNIARRHRIGQIWLRVFQLSTVVGLVALSALAVNIGNSAFGYVALQGKILPHELALDGVPIEEQSEDQLVTVLRENLRTGRLRALEAEAPLADRGRDALYDLVLREVVEPEVVETWQLLPSLLNAGEIRAEVAAEHPDAYLVFDSWLDHRFLVSPQSKDSQEAGVRTAILGSLWVILITILFSLPLGVGAAIYLEEYAGDTPLNRLIQTNIYNLAGVPSIIYGILGLAILVRAMGTITQGRTVLSAGLTLGLLILPLIIINAQEAIRAVPSSLREASYGLGATKWQTVWNHVLPYAMPGILTGTILAVSRAIGETAPIVVIGASTYVTQDPSGPFSSFTVLPIQIYQWTSRPEEEFRHLAAAAIIVLLTLLLSLNAVAVYLRSRYRITY